MTRTNSPPFSLRLRDACLVLSLSLTLSACGGEPSAPAPVGSGGLDRELFVATYVDLRIAAVRSGTSTISDAERTAVLDRHGVTEQQLLEFAELHGRDVEFMHPVWDEVEERLDAERVLPAVDEPAAAPDTSPDSVRPPGALPR